MRIIVFSDTHRHIEPCIRVLKNIIGVDMVLHAGDHISDALELQKLFGDIEFRCVPGNCDFSSVPADTVIESGGKKIFLTHGHGYAVKFDSDYYTIRNKGLSEGCDCVVFGHTHVPVCDTSRGITLLNPGSVKSGSTYGVIEIENGTLKAAICNL